LLRNAKRQDSFGRQSGICGFRLGNNLDAAEVALARDFGRGERHRCAAALTLNLESVCRQRLQLLRAHLQVMLK